MYIVSGKCPVVWLLLTSIGLILLMLGVFAWWYRHQAKRAALANAEVDERASQSAALQESMLQSGQGLILRFEAISRRLPPGHPTREDLVLALDRAERILETGLDRAQHLRDGAVPPKDPGAHRHM